MIEIPNKLWENKKQLILNTKRVYLMRKIELVIFDMDGLMLDTEKLSYDSWKKAASNYGYLLTKEIFLKLLGTNALKIKQTLIETFGKDFPFDNVYEERMKIGNEHTDKYGVQTKEGLLELLTFLTDSGIKKAVATSTNRDRATMLMSRVGIFNFFDNAIYGDEVKRSKPDPEIFLKAAEKFSLKSEACVVLEDSPAGIKAAYSAGMMPIMIPDMVSPDEETRNMAFKVLKNLHEVKELFISEFI